MVLSKMNSCFYDTNICWCMNNLGRCDWKQGTDLMKTTHVHRVASDPECSAPCRVRHIFSSEIMLRSQEFMELSREKNPLHRVLQDRWIQDILLQSGPEPSSLDRGRFSRSSTRVLQLTTTFCSVTTTNNSVQKNKQKKPTNTPAATSHPSPSPTSSNKELNTIELYRNSFRGPKGFLLRFLISF